jgi:hypothetical protein
MEPIETHLEKVRRLLGGQEAPLIDGQRHILGQCPGCGRIWLQRGTTQVLHLTAAGIETWARQLHADLARLPRRACRACQIRLVGGEFALDEYVDAPSGAITGYGVSWERGTPPQHLLFSAVLRSWLERQPAVPEPSVVTNAALAETVLRRLVHRPPPLHFQPFEDVIRTLLTRENTPGAHAPGTDNWTWHGGLWIAHSPELGGDVMISLAQALPSHVRFSLDAALTLWRQILSHALSFGIEGA